MCSGGTSLSAPTTPNSLCHNWTGFMPVPMPAWACPMAVAAAAAALSAAAGRVQLPDQSMGVAGVEGDFAGTTKKQRQCNGVARE